MQALSTRRSMAMVLLLILAVTLPCLARAGEIRSTSRGKVSAVLEAHGFRLEPAYDVQVPPLSTDLAPAQAFEIIRGQDKPVTIGRMFTSCSCIQLEASKRTFQPGERPVLFLRNIRPTPQNGQVYALFVQITSPVRTTLRIDTFVQTGSGKPSIETTESDNPDIPAPGGNPVPGLNTDIAAALTAVDAHPEATGDIVIDPPAAADGGEDEDGDESVDDRLAAAAERLKQDAEDSVAALQDQLELRLPERNSADAADASLDINIDEAREAMNSYFDTAGQGTADMAVDVGELPDFYAPTPQVAQAAAVDTPATAEAETAPAPIAPETPALRPADTTAPAVDTPEPEIAAMDGIPVTEGEMIVIPIQTVGMVPESQMLVPLGGTLEAPSAGFQGQEAATTPATPVLVAPVQVAPPVHVGAPAQPIAPAPMADAVAAQSVPAAAPAPLGQVQAVTLITIGVRDMPAAVRFYEALGWQRAARGKYDQTAFFQLQGQVLALYPMADLLREQEMANVVPAPGGITLALHMREKADVWNAYQRFIDAGGTSLRAPSEMASGAVSSYVADPDGNPWEISWVPQFRIDENGGLWLP